MRAGRYALPLVVDPDLRALAPGLADRQVLVEPSGDVVRDQDATVRDWLDRHLGVGFAMDGVAVVVEEHWVVHRPERSLIPALDQIERVELSSRGFCVAPAAAAAALVVVVAACRYVADQRDLAVL